MVIVFYGYFTALAKTRYAILISLSRGYIFVFLSLLLMPFLFDEAGVWLSMALSETMVLVFAIVLYRKHKRSNPVTISQ